MNFTGDTMDDNFTIPESSPAAAPALNRRGFWGAVGFFLHALAAGSFFSCRRPEPEMKPITTGNYNRFARPDEVPEWVKAVRGYEYGKLQALVCRADGELEWVDVETCE